MKVLLPPVAFDPHRQELSEPVEDRLPTETTGSIRIVLPKDIR